jgi:hypothetical protein
MADHDRALELDKAFAVMEDCIGDPKKQVQCISSIFSLLEESRSQDVGQVVEACVRACKAHPTEGFLQLHAGRVFVAFCSCTCRGCAKQQTIVQKGALQVIIEAKRNHPDNVMLQIVADAIAICCSVDRGEGSVLKMSLDVIRNTTHVITQADGRIAEYHLQELPGRRQG